MTLTKIEQSLSKFAQANFATQYIDSNAEIRDRCVLGRILKSLGITKYDFIREKLNGCYHVNLKTASLALFGKIWATLKEGSQITPEDKKVLVEKAITVFNERIKHFNEKVVAARKLPESVFLKVETFFKKEETSQVTGLTPNNAMPSDQISDSSDSSPDSTLKPAVALHPANTNPVEPTPVQPLPVAHTPAEDDLHTSDSTTDQSSSSTAAPTDVSIALPDTDKPQEIQTSTRKRRSTHQSHHSSEVPRSNPRSATLSRPLHTHNTRQSSPMPSSSSEKH